jgi:superfamily II DNA helicase RecQ
MRASGQDRHFDRRVPATGPVDAEGLTLRRGEVARAIRALDGKPARLVVGRDNHEGTGIAVRVLAGRDLLIERVPAPDDVRQQIDSLLDNYGAVQDQRIAEIAAYAKTRHCRHGHISAYFGGRDVDDCGACDNCLGERTARVHRPAADRHAGQLAVLRCVDELKWAYGRFNLTRILKGAHEAPVHRDANSQHGALMHRSTTAIEKIVDGLIDAGLLKTRRLDHGGEVVEMTPEGRSALANPSRLGDARAN